MRPALGQWIPICALIAVLPAAGVAEDGRAILATALSMRGETRMSGTEVTERTDPGGRRTVVERRMVRDVGGKEFAEFTKGPEFLVGQKVISDGHVRYRVIPSRKVVLQSAPLDGGVLSDMARWRKIQALTQLTVEVQRGKDESTGRDAHILTVKAQTREGVLIKTRRYAVDVATFFILDNRDYHDGLEVSRTRYRSIDFWPKIPEGLFSYSPADDMLVLPEPSMVPRMADPDLCRRLGPLGAPIWPPPDWRPAGAFLQAYGRVRVMQMNFVAPVPGGPLPVVLFRRDVVPERCFFDEFYGLGGLGVQPAGVGHHAWAWQATPFTYVLASRLGPDRMVPAAQQMADETHWPPPGQGPSPGPHGPHHR